MKCVNCDVLLPDSAKSCPLCQGETAADPAHVEPVFPVVPLIVRQNRAFISVMAFFSVVAAVVCVVINYSMPFASWWSLFVVGGLVSFWISFAFIIMKRSDIPKTIVWQVVVLSVIAVAWDLLTGFRRWSIDYVVPIICVIAMAAMAVIARVIRLQPFDYLIYIVIDCILGLVSLILILCGVLTVVLPSAICVGATVISLAALFIFQGKALRAELRRRTHL